MLWLVIKGASHQIVGCNVHFNKPDGNWEVWVEKANGKTLKVKESKEKSDVQEIKDAIDFAIANGHPSLELE